MGQACVPLTFFMLALVRGVLPRARACFGIRGFMSLDTTLLVKSGGSCMVSPVACRHAFLTCPVVLLAWP